MTPSDDEPTRLPDDFLRKAEDGSMQPRPTEPTEQPPADATQAYGSQPFPQQGEQVYGQPGYDPGAYPQQGYGQPAYGYGYLPPARPKHPSATTALVLGIVSLAGLFMCCLPGLVGPFAWYTGAKVKREIDESGGQLEGRGEAQAGMITGIVATVLVVLIVLFYGIVIAIGVAGGFDDGSSSDYNY